MSEMHVVVFAGGVVRAGKRVEEAIASADLIVAADGGAENAVAYGRHPEIIVGDFDSLDIAVWRELEASGCQLVRHAAEKDETDTELAVQIALERGADRITLLGALGGERFDHALGNIFLLADFPVVAIQIIDGPQNCWLLRGPGQSRIEGAVGDLLSLIPLTGNVRGIHTQGLYYSLNGESLRFGRPRGISNVLTQPQAEVSCEEGLLLIMQTEQ